MGLRRDIRWAAGIMEGEGSFGVLRQKGGKYVYPQMRLGMMDADIVEDVARILNMGTHAPRYLRGANDVHFVASAVGPKAVRAMRRLYPHMGARRQARIKEILNQWD